MITLYATISEFY